MNENIKKQIKEEAKKYAETKTIPEAGYILNSRNGFVAGANFILSKWQEADRWRSVDDELPDENKTVLVKDSGGYFFTACISIHGWVNNERSEYVIYRKITHWKPIN